MPILAIVGIFVIIPDKFSVLYICGPEYYAQ